MAIPVELVVASGRSSGTVPRPARQLSGAAPEGVPALQVGYCGTWHRVTPAAGLDIGSDADLTVDESPFLERRLLRISYQGSLWWLSNIGSSTGATLCDVSGGAHSWLPPGSRVPVVSARSSLVFTAGPTTYELELRLDEGPKDEPRVRVAPAAHTPIAANVSFTVLQRQVVVALCEPLLRNDSATLADIPSSTSAAARLGWRLSTFNRKLDNICDKLDKAGVTGLRGGRTKHASNRRGRLVEYALTARLVTPDDLYLLDIDARET